MKAKTIIWINTVLFFLGWTLVMLLGADFPPPSGFYRIVLVILVLDFIQIAYLLDFLPRLRRREKGLFMRTVLFFALGSMILAAFFVFYRTGITLEEGLPWMIIISLVAVIYSTVFWFFNRFLVKGWKE